MTLMQGRWLNKLKTLGVKMNFRQFLNETIEQNNVLQGRTEIRNQFNSDFPTSEDIFFFRHNLEYMSQLPMAIVKVLDLKLVKESIIKWNKSGTQKTTERYYKSNDGQVGVYVFSGTGMTWLKHSIGLLGTKNRDDVINTLKTKGIIKI